ncbi:MAG: flagellar hook-basal body complex protein FliE [Sulfuriferula sp.]
MKTGMIDTSRIEAMMAQLKAAAVRPESTGNVLPTGGAVDKVNFADALKSSLDQVNSTQVQSQQLGQRFAMGDDKVNLSDVMISMQKANISFQATIQVRNKLVAAYNDIMNMQI